MSKGDLELDSSQLAVVFSQLTPSTSLDLSSQHLHHPALDTLCDAYECGALLNLADLANPFTASDGQIDEEDCALDRYDNGGCGAG